MDVAISRRTSAAHAYFLALRNSLDKHWEDLHGQVIGDPAATLQAKLVLVHPMWLPEGATTPDRQRRAFSTPAPTYERCASQLLWGYECPFVSELHVDHLFPFALGGPTSPENAVYLCRDHNLAKGHDVHFHPWTPDRFEWLDSEIAAVATVRRL